ncbi:hypothetical protein IE53DRAFT_369557 [Violaceomyces palustris]|uniref:Uncharacterized protein n=1 Tax=Violaceomyces palustris TaxID=1673888 RepID=A0ACD0NV24_9BASI|nr:hypothetical protein IE53DRAFT_369557 [Violaceomyces palustris]
MSRYPPFKEAEAAREPFDDSIRFKVTKTKETGFKPGQGLNDHVEAKRFADEEASYNIIQIGKTDVESSYIYKLLISGIVPRPVALVTTLNEEGFPNLAPISWYQMVSHDPPMVMLSFGGTEGRRKDSELNIKRTKEFTISSSNEHIAEALNYASVDCPPGVSEFVLAGLTPIESKVVKTPRVKESPFSMECELDYVREIRNDAGKHTSTMCLGRVKVIHFRKDTVNPVSGAVDPAKAMFVSRMGGLLYSRVISGYELERRKWTDIQDQEEVKSALEKGINKTLECKDPVLERYP